jgi:hypothetical protein
VSFEFKNKPKNKLKHGENSWEVRIIPWREKIQFEILFVIDTSSNSPRILNYLKDSESKQG